MKEAELRFNKNESKSLWK